MGSTPVGATNEKLMELKLTDGDKEILFRGLERPTKPNRALKNAVLEFKRIEEMKMHSLKEIVKDNTAKLSYICAGIAYYDISVDDSIYQLGINSNDDEWKTTYLYPEFKAITLMRWIRKALDNGELIKMK